MAVMMALSDVEAEPLLNTAVSHREPQRERHSGQVLEKPALNLGTQDRYI